jgi:hypothetical protein
MGVYGLQNVAGICCNLGHLWQRPVLLWIMFITLISIDFLSGDLDSCQICTVVFLSNLAEMP